MGVTGSKKLISCLGSGIDVIAKGGRSFGTAGMGSLDGAGRGAVRGLTKGVVGCSVVARLVLGRSGVVAVSWGSLLDLGGLVGSASGGGRCFGCREELVESESLGLGSLDDVLGGGISRGADMLGGVVTRDVDGIGFDRGCEAISGRGTLRGAGVPSSMKLSPFLLFISDLGFGKLRTDVNASMPH